MLVLPINFFAFIYIFFNVLKYYTYKKVFMQYLFTKKYNISWWAQMESNHRPHAYQACALTI